MNPQIGNAAAMFFDDFGPRPAAPVILIRGQPFKRTAQAPGRRPASPPVGLQTASDLHGCKGTRAGPGTAPTVGPAQRPGPLTGRPEIEQTVVGDVSNSASRDALREGSAT